MRHRSVVGVQQSTIISKRPVICPFMIANEVAFATQVVLIRYQHISAMK